MKPPQFSTLLTAALAVFGAAAVFGTGLVWQMSQRGADISGASEATPGIQATVAGPDAAKPPGADADASPKASPAPAPTTDLIPGESGDGGAPDASPAPAPVPSFSASLPGLELREADMKSARPGPDASERSTPGAAPADACDFRSLRVGERGAFPARVSEFVSTFMSCRRAGEGEMLATRSMTIDGQTWLLIVDPQTLSTRLQREAPACWTCVATTDKEQATTRLIGAADRAAAAPGVEHRTFLQNAGLTRGEARGDFVTGDLCPSSRALDRRLFDTIAGANAPTPVALSITGLWLENHDEDFRWLQGLERQGKIDIVWVNHSFHHPYAPRQPLDRTFLLTKDLDLDREVLDTERLLIAHGGVPSVFFRFPGLISSKPLMDVVRKHHLISLGAEAWLAKGEQPRDGSIILVHPNGNEERGLDIFQRLFRDGKVSLPLEPITLAP